MLRIAVAFLLALVVADSADACTRCGLFGRRCRFAHQVIAPVVVATPVIVEEVPVVQQPSTLVIQNNYNAPNGAAAALIAQPGNTVYGLQQAAQPLLIDPNEHLRRAAQLVDSVTELAQKGLQGYQQNTSLALTLSATQPLISQAVQAPQQFTAQHSSSQTITLKQGGDGRWQLDVGQPGQAGASTKPQAVEAPQIRPNASQSLVAKHCASCHGLDNPTPKARLNFDAGHQLDCETAMAGVRSVLNGKMPKGKQLSPDERELLVAELVELSEKN